MVENGAAGTATLTVNSAANTTYAGTIQDGAAGTLALIKGGAGALSLGGVNTFTGATTINGGVLAVNGTNSGGGLVTVASSGTLGGVGSITGAVTVSSGGAIAPGTSVGTITLGSLTLDAGSGLTYEFNTTPANDQIVITTSDGLVINGGAFTVYSEGTQTAWGTNGVYNLISYTGSIGGSGIGSLSTANAAPGKQYTFGTSGGWVTLTVADGGLVADWNVDADGLWTTNANWNPSAPNGDGDAANFGSAITAPRTITLDADRTIGGVTFDNANAYTIAPSSTQSLTMGNGSGTKVVQVLTGTHTISAPVVMASSMQADVASGQKLTLSGAISGSGSLNKTQAGTLVLGTANSYTGSTNLNAGTTEFVAGGLGNGSALNIGGGATLKYTSGNTDDISTKTVTVGAGGAVIDTNGNDVLLANAIGNAGSGGLTKAGSGALTLNGANTYFGGTVINAGSVVINSASSLGDASGSATIGNATLRSTATFSSSRNFSLGHANSAVSVDPSTVLTIGGVVSGAGTLNKTGDGTLTLTGSNSFAASVISGGVVALGGVANTGIGTGSVTFQGGTLSSNAAGGSDPGGGGYGFVNNFIVPAGQTGTLNLPFRGNNTGSLTGSGTFNVNTHGTRDDFAGNWSAFTGQINVGTATGSGDFRINNTSGYGGAAMNLAAGVSMYVSTNFSTNPTTFNIGELSGDATSSLTGQNVTNSARTAIYSVGGRNTDATFAGVIRDGNVSAVVQPTAITKVGTGIWTLTGTSTYTGATTVSAGTLLVEGALGNTTITVGSAGRLGGTGILGGSLVFGQNATLVFNPTTPLTVSGSVTFANPASFGVNSIIGLSSSTPEGIYTLIAGNVDTTGLANFGSANAYDLGSGKLAYFQQGSLQLVVVPEPSLVASSVAGGLVVVLLANRRRKA